jgi:hypothetical protein
MASLPNGVKLPEPTAPYFNPRPIDRGGIRALLDDAYYGHRPH